MFRPITKMSKRIESAERIEEFMRMAFRTAQSGRKGPVYLGIPRNVQKEKAFSAIWPKESYRAEGVVLGDPAAIDRACDMLCSAKTAVMLVGGGARWSRAEKEILQLAELLGIPVAASHKGFVTEDHPWSAGVVGMTGSPVAMDVMADADVVLGLGCTFNQVTTASYTHRVIPEAAKIIQIDIDPLEMGRNFPIALGIVGDLKAVLQQMIQKIDPKTPSRKEERLNQLLAAKEAFRQRLLSEGAESDAAPINRLRLMRDIGRVIDKNAIVSAESGSTHGWFYYGFTSHTPLLEPGDLSAMGSGWCMAMGAHFGFPQRQVVSFIGDGAFMMTLNELATAVDHKIPIVVVVEHNEVYGNVRRKQIEHFDNRFAGSELYIPDLAKVAQAFGAHGERVEKPREIIPAMERALSSGRPSVLDVVVDKTWDSLEPPVKLRVKDRY